MPVRLPSTSTVYAITRLGIASNARPIVCPRPTNVIAISAKKTPATAQSGMMNRLGSLRAVLGAEVDELAATVSARRRRS